MKLPDRPTIGPVAKRAPRAASVLLCVCAGLLAVQPVRAATLTPVLNCISDVKTAPNANGYLHTHVTAHIGYINTSTTAIDVPIGLDNFFLPGRANAGQPTEFLPGRHDYVFTARFDATAIPIYTWVLGDPEGSTTALRIRNDPTRYCPATISSVSPANGRRGQTVTLNIAGADLGSAATVKLLQGSLPLPVSVASAVPTQITASVAIPYDAPKGFYDLRVSHPGQTPTVLPDAFEVTDSASSVRALVRLSPGVLLAGTTGAGVYLSTDGGANWAQTNTGLTDLNVTALAAAVDGSAVYAGTLTGGVFKSTDGGASWVPAGAGLDPHIHSLLADPADPLVLFAGTDKGVYKTVDGGLHWQAMPNGLP